VQDKILAAMCLYKMSVCKDRLFFELLRQIRERYGRAEEIFQQLHVGGLAEIMAL
jgi:hypothetical protein